MSNYFIVPVVQVTQTFGGQPQTVNVPKYSALDSTEVLYSNFGAIPFGVEPATLLSLSATNPALTAMPDVFTFPADLTTLLADADVTALDAFCAPLNIPTSFAITGMTWQAVLQQIAQVFLVAQAVSGANGAASLFANGATLDDAVQPVQAAQLSKGVGNLKSGGVSQQAAPSALANAAGGVAGPFDLTNVDVSQSIGDTLLSISQQFSAPILIGGGTI